MNVKEFEKRVDIERDDPALIAPRLEAFRAKEKAVKSGDPRQILYAETRLAELKELR